jgi:hypothetical protein
MQAPLHAPIEREGLRERDRKKREKHHQFFGSNALLPAFTRLTLMGYNDYDVARTIPNSQGVRLLVSRANKMEAERYKMHQSWMHTELEAQKRNEEGKRERGKGNEG